MSSVNELKDIVRAWQGKRIGVIGDVMLDHYIDGEVTRISPEAPVPIVNVTREWYAPGGAANVAANVAALGGNVALCGVIGFDEAAEELVREVKKCGVSFRAVVARERLTTEKTRVLVHNQQVVRIDREVHDPIGPTVIDAVYTFIKESVLSWHGVVLSDYAKGMFNYESGSLKEDRLAQMIIALALWHNKPVIVDPKLSNTRGFSGATIMTPNQKEAQAIADDWGVSVGSLASALGNAVLVTEGSSGMTLYQRDGTRESICARSRPVFDVVGAGDTVVAALALGLSVNASFFDAARLANAAASVVVGKRGTATVSTDELLKALDEIEEHEWRETVG